MGKILVIDDETTILQNIQFVLELENYQVLSTSNGEEGIRIFKENMDAIDAVITDIRMPRLSGMDVLKEVKTLYAEMSVIILTGHGDLENAILAMKEGAFEFLRKPVDAEKLTITVHNAIARKNLLIENTLMQKEIVEHRNYLQRMQYSAQKILLNMLPKELPSFPGYAFSVEYKSSDDVGGDMYNVADNGNYICFYVFDVSSHGILAAVISILLHSFLKNIPYKYGKRLHKKHIQEIVHDLNLELLSNTAQNVFATLFLGFIDKKRNLLHYVSAGHIPQYLTSETRLEALSSNGTILGVFEDATFTCHTVPIHTGDKLILFTDGIVEAAQGDTFFGFENVERLLKDHASASAQTLIQLLHEKAHAFSDGTFLDDITLLGIEKTS